MKNTDTEILKEDLGFEGFLISDYNAMDQIDPADIKKSIMISINAGMDMAMVPSAYGQFFNNLKELVEEGRVPMARIDVAVINNLKRANIPVVVLVISGRPLIIDEILPRTDALLAAFLPGTEGKGIADVFFGDFNPTGKLSFSWPKSNDQLPPNINSPKEKYDPLFAFGYGLSYE